MNKIKLIIKKFFYYNLQNKSIAVKILEYLKCNVSRRGGTPNTPLPHKYAIVCVYKYIFICVNICSNYYFMFVKSDTIFISKHAK